MHVYNRKDAIDRTFNCLENQPVRPMKRCSTASSVAQGVSHAVCPGVLRPCGRAQVERAGKPQLPDPIPSALETFHHGFELANLSCIAK